MPLSLHRWVAVVCAAWVTFAFSYRAAASVIRPGSAAIRVSVEGFRSPRGRVGCALYNTQRGFPMKPVGSAVAQSWAAIQSGVAHCEFTNLKPGKYAVTVLHDENTNAKLDSNFLGIPREGYGVSNNRTYRFRAPKWEESVFALTSGQALQLKILLHYH